MFEGNRILYFRLYPKLSTFANNIDRVKLCLIQTISYLDPFFFLNIILGIIHFAAPLVTDDFCDDAGRAELR